MSSEIFSLNSLSKSRLSQPSVVYPTSAWMRTQARMSRTLSYSWLMNTLAHGSKLRFAKLDPRDVKTKPHKRLQVAQFDQTSNERRSVLGQLQKFVVQPQRETVQPRFYVHLTQDHQSETKTTSLIMKSQLTMSIRMSQREIPAGVIGLNCGTRRSAMPVSAEYAGRCQTATKCWGIPVALT